MLIGLNKQEIDQWKQSLHTYEKGKRTKRPFGKQQQIVEHKTKADVYQQQMKFNPVLQSFRDEREYSKTIEHEEIQKVNQQIKFMKNNYKYNPDYDIINFAPAISLPTQYKSQSLGPQNRKKKYKDLTYNEFDIINGKSYNENYLTKKRYQPTVKHQRKILPKNQRIYDIVSGKYKDCMQNQSTDMSRTIDDTLNKSTELRVYDNILGHYYNPETQDQYQQDLKEKQKYNSEHYSPKLPPSYINREPYIQDREEQVSPIIAELDKKRQNAKKRYNAKYIAEQEYKLMNEYLTQKKDQQAKNRVHNGRVLEQKFKQFNIINSERYENNRAEKLFGKEITSAVYDLKPIAQSYIKQRGFSDYHP